MATVDYRGLLILAQTKFLLIPIFFCKLFGKLPIIPHSQKLLQLFPCSKEGLDVWENVDPQATCLQEVLKPSTISLSMFLKGSPCIFVQNFPTATQRLMKSSPCLHPQPSPSACWGNQRELYACVPQKPAQPTALSSRW